MILWNDFILDDVCGPILAEGAGESVTIQVSRGKRLGSPSVMEDAGVRAVGKQIQETGQEQRPARMVGHSASDSFKKAQDCIARIGMDADRGYRAEDLRQGGEA